MAERSARVLGLAAPNPTRAGMVPAVASDRRGCLPRIGRRRQATIDQPDRGQALAAATVFGKGRAGRTGLEPRRQLGQPRFVLVDHEMLPGRPDLRAQAILADVATALDGWKALGCHASTPRSTRVTKVSVDALVDGRRSGS